MEKNCTDCGENQGIKFFHKNKAAADGLCNICKVCASIRKKANWIKIKPTYKKKPNPIKRKQYREENKDLIAIQKRKYYQSKRDVLIKISYLKKKDRILKDPVFKLRNNISSLINSSFRNKKWRKSSKTQTIVGCNFQELKDHLEKTFFDNYGRSISEEDKIHIDHKIPISIAKSESELIALNHFSNLQYLLATDNFKKSNKVNFSLEA